MDGILEGRLPFQRGFARDGKRHRRATDDDYSNSR
jgi:hypothetical protein